MNERIKVLHILNTGSYSGAENVVITLINNTKSKVKGIYCSLDGTIRDVLYENDIHFEPVNKLSIDEIKKVIKKVKPDIIHAHDFTAGIICSLAAGNIPVINHLHNNSPWLKNYCIKSFVYAYCCRKFKKILTVSDSVMDEFVFGKKMKDKTLVVGNPIDLSNILSKADINADKKYDIAFLGRLTEAKAPEVFVDIISQVKKQNKNIKAIMIGDGELRGKVETEIEKFNLNDNIDLVGFQKNPYTFLVQSKILCMPSKWEGFGLAAVEALAYKLPVVASQVGGLKNIINDSCGKLCSNVYEFVDELLKLLNENEYYNNKRVGAYKRAQEYDNIELYSKKIISIYSELSNREIS